MPQSPLDSPEVITVGGIMLTIIGFLTRWLVGDIRETQKEHGETLSKLAADIHTMKGQKEGVSLAVLTRLESIEHLLQESKAELHKQKGDIEEHGRQISEHDRQIVVIMKRQRRGRA